MTTPTIEVRVVPTECFTFVFPDERGTVVWNIAQVKQIVSDGRKPQLQPSLEELKFMLEMNGQASEIDDEYAMTKDLSQPLIAIVQRIDEMPDGRLNVILTCIDGWHRIRKAVLIGHPSLPMYLLHPKEDQACRIMEARR